MLEALDIEVVGVVQGVGFRPFVYRLARRHLVSGWVLNDGQGVRIHAEGESSHLDAFALALADEAPAAARVERVRLHEVALRGCEGFSIKESRPGATGEAHERTLVSPDLATCDACVAELFDSADRRYRYPFINCTDCGPRFTIIDRLPYDRPATSMGVFPMCDACAEEYADPANRRFHAEPDACFDCGPSLSWWEPGGEGADAWGRGSACGFLSSTAAPAEGCAGDSAGRTGGEAAAIGPAATGRCAEERVSWGRDRDASDSIIARAVRLLAQGKILAVKGVGGFHLACDAMNERAVARLRARKRRPGKAFAVMVPDVAEARRWCSVDADEETLLSSPARPIVLLGKRSGAALAPSVSDPLAELGVMLPSTPVQHLLLHDYQAATGKAVLVMTSGNVHDSPIVIDDAAAQRDLGSIADAVLGNNRQILARYDDSVARVIALPGGTSAVQIIRRARGYAPLPLKVTPAPEELDHTHAAPGKTPVVLAAGSQQKSTLCYLRGSEAFVSQHIGDREDAAVDDAWFDAKERFERLFDLGPTCLACDAHPAYVASQWARTAAGESGVALVEVQHHHAHIASVLGEHGLSGPVCGIAFDGTGAGPDGAVWGGEVLIANRSDYERFANFSYVPMPGAAACVRHPLRMAYGVLWAFDLLEHPAAVDALKALGGQAPLCSQMIERTLNTPFTSSVGRLFDAAAALLGVCQEATYEGEPAVLLDSAQHGGSFGWCATGDAAKAAAHLTKIDAQERYRVDIVKNAAGPTSTAHDTSVVLFDAAPLFKALLDDKQAGVGVSVIARRFHEAIARAAYGAAALVRSIYGIETVALSGGVFMNKFLLERTAALLAQGGFTVALNAELPPNDGCLSFGQSIVAASRL